MKQMMEPQEYESFVASYDRPRAQALRINPLKSTDLGDQKNVLDRTFALEPVPWAENGYYYDPDEAPGKHPYHEAGVYYIQEPSAMAPVTFLDAAPGEKILDLCAAPGGKTTQIAAAMQGKGILVANEPNPNRAKILALNIERLGISNAIVVSALPDALSEIFQGYFDRILVDAPCSGEGMFRKNEEAETEWSTENVEMCADRQEGILREAVKMLAPGGRIVYSTCTFAPAEDEAQISRFLKENPDFICTKVEASCGMESGRKEWAGEDPADGVENSIRLWPHKMRGEGHYLAVLDREGDLSSNPFRVSANGLLVGVPSKDLKLFREFEEETLNPGVLPEGVFHLFGDQLYLAPKDSPAFTRLKVLRPGLHLGTIKKNRFEPGHALALYLKEGDVKRTARLTADSQEAMGFIGGQTLQDTETGKGWCLVTVDGFSLGWGKSDGRIIKNHYPKGLRIYT